MKVILILITILILTILTFELILKFKNKKIKEQKNEIDLLNKQVENKECELNLIKEEMKIEKEYNQKLIKKISVISCMSINDVLTQLQND